MAVTVLLGTAGVVAANASTRPSAEPSANASTKPAVNAPLVDDGRDVVWDMAGGARAYNATIEAVRTRVSGGTVLREGMLQTTTGNDFFTINIRHTNAPSSAADNQLLRLIVRCDNAYIIGWLVQNPATQAEEVYFFKGMDNGYRGTTGAATVIPVPFGGSYGELEGAAGRTRQETPLNANAMIQVFSEMRNGGTNQRDTARALLTFALVLAEGARFDVLQGRFAPAFDSANVEVRSADVELTNSWGKLSKQIVTSLNTGTPINFQIDTVDTPTVEYQAMTTAQAAVLIALVLMSL